MSKENMFDSWSHFCYNNIILNMKGDVIMWSRVELKERAKVAFKRNYWKCVLVAFILSLFAGSGTFTATSNVNLEDVAFQYFGSERVAEIIGLISSILIALAVLTTFVSLIVRIFVLNPMEIGGCKFFVNNTYGSASAKDLFAAFKNGRYWDSVGIVLLRNIFIGLWSLLFLIPGIIKAYEYRMVTYLIAEHPDMTRKEAFQISKEMMRGQKMDTFVLDLSFFGWYFLNIFTFGLLNLFYVQPYVMATDAELYLVLRNQYFYKDQEVIY